VFDVAARQFRRMPLYQGSVNRAQCGFNALDERR
jgi:hypothetical protein